jgi:hypothetical protein
MIRKRVLLPILLVFFNVSSIGRAQTGVVSQKATITYVKSSYADFLFYLLYRSTGVFPDLRSAVPLDGVNPFTDDSFLPNDVATSEAKSYSDLYKVASTYDAHIRLAEILAQGEPRYAAFSSFWQSHIAPQEEETIGVWKRQDTEWPTIVHLEETERLKFPFSSVRIAVLALNPQANSMQGPPTIFTTTEVPSLAWVMGHEGTHMMLGPKGADWKNRKNGDEAVHLMNANNGSDYDVEEALCLLMQAKLSIAFGATPKNYLTSRDFKATTPRRTLLIALEHDWAKYEASPDVNIADFLISETIKTFGKHP